MMNQNTRKTTNIIEEVQLTSSKNSTNIVEVRGFITNFEKIQ